MSGPTHAVSFTLNANGSFTYTPAANYNGPDSFTYRARDAALAQSNIVTIVAHEASPEEAQTLANTFAEQAVEERSTELRSYVASGKAADP